MRHSIVEIVLTIYECVEKHCGVLFAHPHTRGVLEANKADPDDGNSWLCFACNLPIFSTPFKTTSKNNKLFRLHDQCAQLPGELKDRDLHPGHPLFLKKANLDDFVKNPSCSNCKRQCGSMYYHCPDCKLQLDILCAWQINVMHRSHKHRIMAICSLRGAAALVCGACGTQHADGDRDQDPSYLCKVCGFWIHPKCASLPNAVLLKHHPHSLFLTYRDSSVEYRGRICGGEEKGSGYFFCPKCSYHAHITCVMSHPLAFNSVPIGDVNPSDLLRLPMPNEHASLIRYIIENSTSTSTTSISTSISTTSISTSTSRDEEKLQLHAEAGEWELHQHPLLFYNQEKEEEDGPHQCNACIQSISPPFYTCSKCPDFYLHNSCLNLPTEIKHRAHKNHTLILLPKSPEDKYPVGFLCRGCRNVSNGFIYFCKTCEFSLDVICALMPAAITHESHGKTHILHVSSILRGSLSPHKCNCCGWWLSETWYECSSCRDFKLHAKCALLPSSLTHKFDEHTLKLTTNARPRQICEVCEEEGMDERRWCYSCDECDHSFHVNCISCVDSYSRVKLGGSVSVSVRGHDCPFPLKLIRSSTVYGYRCACCCKKFRPKDEGSFAYECFKCYFRVHAECIHRYTPPNLHFR